MNIIMVRSLKGYPDSRVEKELYSISKENNIVFFGWNRYKDSLDIDSEYVNVFGKRIKYYHYNKKAPIGLGFKKLLFPLLGYWKAEYKFLKKHNKEYDVIHACDFDTIIPSLRIANKYHKKVVYDIFDYYSEAHYGPAFIKKKIKEIEDTAIGKADITIICSEKRREQIKDSSPKKLVIIHNSPMEIKDIERSNDNLVGDSNKVKLVYVGLLSDDRYLKNIAEVVSSRNDMEWHVGGWGPLNDYFVNLSEKNKNIKYYGEVPYITALKLEKQCDIMTALYDPNVPNHKYAAPNKFYEALMLGKPLIMIKNTGMDHYVSENKIGEVINLDNGDFNQQFNNALSDLISHKDNWKEISQKSKKLYDDEFSWKTMEERLLMAYRDLW